MSGKKRQIDLFNTLSSLDGFKCLFELDEPTEIFRFSKYYKKGIIQTDLCIYRFLVDGSTYHEVIAHGVYIYTEKVLQYYFLIRSGIIEEFKVLPNCGFVSGMHGYLNLVKKDLDSMFDLVLSGNKPMAIFRNLTMTDKRKLFERVKPTNLYIIPGYNNELIISNKGKISDHIDLKSLKEACIRCLNIQPKCKFCKDDFFRLATNTFESIIDEFVINDIYKKDSFLYQFLLGYPLEYQFELEAQIR